jgi:acylphosphatase
MIAKQIIVHGDVQGVSYRYFARTEAKKLELTGWAKNEHDGTVSVFIQGDGVKVGEFLEWAKLGSPMAEVGTVEVSEAEVNDSFKGFEVK